MAEVQRCTRCVLPDSYPDIQFDNSGVCNFCLESSAEKPVAENSKQSDLDDIIKQYRDKNGKYDAIVPLSGGKDSTYVALYLKQKYDLKILGVNFDIGYRSSYAVENLEIIADKLDIDLLTIRSNKRFFKKLFKHFLIKRGEFCSVCNNLGYLIIASFIWNQRLALGFSPLAVAGWSKKYEFQPGISVTSMRYFFDNLTPELLEELVSQTFIEAKVVDRYSQITDPRQAQIGTEKHQQLGEYAMDIIQLPDYIEWNIREIPDILIETIGWKSPPDVHESHFDCVVFPVKEYLKYKKYGLSQETIKNSRLIREGLMTREEAMERTAMEQTAEPEIFQPFLNELGISMDELNWDAEWSR